MLMVPASTVPLAEMPETIVRTFSMVPILEVPLVEMPGTIEWISAMVPVLASK